MVKIIQRYIIKKFLLWFGLCSLGILSLISLLEASELTRRSMGKILLPPSILAEMVLLKLPYHFQTLMPFLVLASLMVCLTKLSKSYELIAIRAMGYSVWQIISSLLYAVTFLNIIFLFILSPFSAATSTRLQSLNNHYFSQQKDAFFLSSNGLWIKEVSSNGYYLIHANQLDYPKQTFKQATFFQFNNTDQLVGRYDVGDAVLSNSQWQLKNVSLWPSNDTALDINLSTKLSFKRILQNHLDAKYISFWELPSFISLLEKAGLSSHSHWLVWASYLGKALMMIAMIFLAACFCLHHPKSTRITLLITLGVCISFIIYFVNDLTYALGMAQKLPIYLAVGTLPLITLLGSFAYLLLLEEI